MIRSNCTALSPGRFLPTPRRRIECTLPPCDIMLTFLASYINTTMKSVSDFDPFELPIFRDGVKKKKSALAARLWEAWKRFGMAVAKVNLYVLVFVIFWTIFAVTAVIVKLLRRDWLQIKHPEREFWHPIPHEQPDMNKCYRQF